MSDLDEFIQYHHNPIVADLNKQLAAERERNSADFIDRYRDVEELQQQLAAEQETIQQLRKQLDAAVGGGNKTLAREWKLREQLDAEREKVEGLTVSGMAAVGKLMEQLNAAYHIALRLKEHYPSAKGVNELITICKTQ